MGDQFFSSRDRYLLDEPEPDFFEKISMNAIFPGCAPLVLKVMDFDDIFGDDLIGQTTFDLEDRFYCH